MSKIRKPRVTPARLEAAKKYCELSQMCILICQGMERSEIVDKVREEQPSLFRGLEYLYDILAWEEDKLEKQKAAKEK